MASKGKWEDAGKKERWLGFGDRRPLNNETQPDTSISE